MRNVKRHATELPNMPLYFFAELSLSRGRKLTFGELRVEGKASEINIVENERIYVATRKILYLVGSLCARKKVNIFFNFFL